MIKVITGIRRCGKSYLLNNIFYNHLLQSGIDRRRIIKFAFDSQKDLTLIGEDYYDIIETNRKVDPRKFSGYIYGQIADDEPYYLLLDEVQQLGAFEGVLNGLLYQRNLDIYVTGSNSKFLSTDVISEFRGRGDEIKIHPLSFAEFFSVYGGDKISAWQEYCNYGGMPLILSQETSVEKADYLSRLFKETYIRDLVERNHIREENEFGEIIDVLASAIGSLTNPQKIVNTFLRENNKSVSAQMVKRHIGYLQEAFLVSCSKRYNIKGRKYINTPSKYYFEDIGLRNVRLNFRQTEYTHIMENIVFNELIMRGYNVDVGIVEYRQRTADGRQLFTQLEVDFVCNSGNRRYYIQSAYSIPNKEKMEQECAPLDRIDDSFKKIIVVQDFLTPISRNDKGYLVINILDFLLNPDSLDL